MQQLSHPPPHGPRLESIVRDCVTDIKRRLKELLQREAKVKERQHGTQFLCHMSKGRASTIAMMVLFL